jgi:cytoskeletal protein CcmA (bactofilin family)
MATIPPNNNTGLYGIDGSTVAVDNNITTGNITATGNLAVGGNATVVGSVTANTFG